jgi:hypothetical protein
MLPPSPDRLVVPAAIIRVGVPFVATTFLYALAPAVDPLPALLRASAFVLVPSFRLLWPPVVRVLELERQEVMLKRLPGCLGRRSAPEWSDLCRVWRLALVRALPTPLGLARSRRGPLTVPVAPAWTFPLSETLMILGAQEA